MRLGIADHLGWAVLVTVSRNHVVDRRRVELVEPGVPVMPIHHGIEELDDAGAAALIARVRASAERASAAALDNLAAALPECLQSVSLRTWSPDFPTDLAVLRRMPWDARADAVMYRQVLAEHARARGWALHLYDAKAVLAQATERLGGHAKAVLDGPLGPPWTKDHRVALAAAILAEGP